MGRIATTFDRLRQQGEAGLIPFIVAGDPDMETTAELIRSIAAAGADLIELGVPFSDPMADGPTIQFASERALASGASLAKILDLVRSVRAEIDTPIVLMGYFNPIFVYGPERFARDAAAAGVDGVLVVDLPPEEAGELKPFLTANGVDMITLVAPTTPDKRLPLLVSEAQGFVYYVSMAGITGVKKVDPAAIAAAVARVQKASPVPVGVGFGITTPEDAAAVAGFADAVVVGSALVKRLESATNSADAVRIAGEFVASLKAGIAGKKKS